MCKRIEVEGIFFYKIMWSNWKKLEALEQYKEWALCEWCL